MPLVSMRQLLDEAAKGGYGVGAFNVNNMEQIQAIVVACVETQSPVILQVSSGARKYANQILLRYMGQGAVEMMKAYAKEKNLKPVPISRQRTLRIPRQPPLNRGKRTVEPHRHAVIRNQVIILFAQKRPASERDYVRFAGLDGPHAFAQRRALHFPERGFSLPVENLGDRGLGPQLDLSVEVAEIPSQLFGQRPPDSRFPGPHEPHQINTGRTLEFQNHLLTKLASRKP